MPLPIAIDYRPALLSRAGIGRATRELGGAGVRGATVDGVRAAVLKPGGRAMNRAPRPAKSRA